MKFDNRYDELRCILNENRYFKVVCGAGNEDVDEVFKLCMIYTLAGANGIDVSANVKVVRASIAGIDLAYEIAEKLNIEIKNRPFITVSVGLNGDPHVRKANIDSYKCVGCGLCFDVCAQQAIEKPIEDCCDITYKIISNRCIGCGKCSEACIYDAITYHTKKVDFSNILPKCIEAGADNIELHAIVEDDVAVLNDLSLISDVLPFQFISMCLDRSMLSNDSLIRRVGDAWSIVGDRLIIQADGAPMSGGVDDFNTTLQSIACADIIRKSGIQCKVLLSGGTNTKTGELANLCGVRANGVSLGTFARNIVRSEIKDKYLILKYDVIEKAYMKAKLLVHSNLKYIGI